MRRNFPTLRLESKYIQKITIKAPILYYLKHFIINLGYKYKLRITICLNLLIYLFLPHTNDHKQTLRMHPRTHTGEKPFKRNICFVSFKYPSLLTNRCVNDLTLPYIEYNKHRIRNIICTNLVIFLFLPITGENPSLCKICNIHPTKHTGEKPLSRTVCIINSYCIFHTEEKPLPCNLCVSYHVVETNIFNHAGKKHLCFIITHKKYADNLTYVMPP